VPVALFASVLLVAHDGLPARAPNLVEKSFTYRGDAARAFAALLGLSSDRRIVRFELPESDDHSAIHETATWDPAADVLRLEGYVADRNTALPRQGGLAFSFSSPWFSETESEQVPGWKPLLAKLATLPATAAPGGAVVRKLDISLDGEERALLSLWHVQAWDSKDLPIPKSFVTVEFGPPLSSGSPHACGCRVGQRGSPWGSAVAGALALLALRRRRPSTSRTPRPASPAPRSPGSDLDS
jgi:MYXO-CTERM domain-containing protein